MITKLPPTQIVGYYRVSTHKQGFDGLGMDAQRASVVSYAARMGLPIVASYEEVETGRKSDLRNRPQLVAALAHARRSRALLVIARLDRLSRNVAVTSQLMESEVDFVACDNPTATRLTIQILAAIAEHESRMISERVKASVAAARARGYVYKNYSPITPEAILLGIAASREARLRRTREAYSDLVPLIHAKRIAGGTQQQIADDLNSMGHRNQFGRHWSDIAVGKFLKREGFGDLTVPRSKEDHVSGAIQAAATKLAALERNRRTRAYYAPFAPLLRDLYSAGLSSVAIARELNDRDLKTQGGSPWYPSAVFNALRYEGIAPPPESGMPGLKSPIVNAEGRRQAAIRISEIAAKHRARLFLILRMLLERNMTTAQLVSHLNQNGHHPARAKSWNSSSLFTYLRNHRDELKATHSRNRHGQARP